MSRNGFIRLAFIPFMTLALASRATAVGPPDGLKADKPHPPLALWTIEHDRPVSLASLRGQKIVLIHFASWNPKCREQVSAWFQQLRPHVTAKKLVVLGVDHEQHADRGRLFAQWKGLTEPILHDPLDLSGVTKIPTFIAIDEEGIVRSIHSSLADIENKFIHRRAAKPNPHSGPQEAALPDPRITRRTAEQARNALAHREHADALVLAGFPPQIKEAIETYQRALELDPKDAWSFFRLGVVCRIRCEQDARQPGDFQAAADAWEQAVRLAPTCEIFRQRLQQYGPAVGDGEAPYDWIPVARREIAKNGKEPIPLEIEPLPIEMAIAVPTGGSRPPTSAKGKSLTDKEKLVQIEPTVVRAADHKHAGTLEVHLTLRLNGTRWDNREEPVQIWLEKSKTARPERSFIELPNPKSETSEEPRTVSVKVESKNKSNDKLTIKGYAVYRIRDKDGGKAKTLRQEFKVTAGAKPERKSPGHKPPVGNGDEGGEE